MSKDSMSDHKMEYYLLNAKLCQLIRAHPCMYDRSAPNYLKKEYVDSAWGKISREVKDTVASCKERWRNIRTAYARSVNIYKSPSGPNRHKRYYLHDELQFLTKHLSPGLPSLRILTPTELDENHENSRQSMDQQSDDNCTFEITLDSSTPSPPAQEKTQTQHVPIPEPEPELESELAPEPDYVEPPNHQSAKKRHRSISNELPIIDTKAPKKDIDSEFLNSLLPEMKSMNSRQKILFKGKIFQALEEVFSDSKDFPQKEERFTPQINFPTPGTGRKLVRRFFGNKVSTDRREKLLTVGSTKTGSKIPMVQLAHQSHNDNLTIKQETESVEVDD